MNGLELIQAAITRWRDGEGSGASTYMLCQKFDGWYVSRVQSDKSALRAYESARAAYRASTIFTKNWNDKAIQPGDSLYYSWNPYDHVVTAIGWDGDRLLVSQTAHGGDTVMQLANGVKISHADTIGLPFLGASHQNGSNPRRNGITPYTIGAPSWGGGGNPAPSEKSVNLTEPWFFYRSAAEAEGHRNPQGGKYTGAPMLSGPYKVFETSGGGALKVLSKANGWVWLAPEAQSRIVGGGGGSTPPPAPATKKFTPPDTIAYWYTSRADANALRNVHGDGGGRFRRYTSEPMLKGEYVVVDDPGDSFAIRANDGSTVYVSGKLRHGIH